MNVCPHCGAALGENARFCAQCMTSLDHKRVVPTPKYLPIRWLSLAAAVLVLCGAVGGGWMAARQMAQENLPVVIPTTQTAAPSTEAPTTVPTTSDVPTTTLTTAPITTLTTLAEWFSTSMENTTTTGITTTTSTTYPNPTYATIPTAPTTTTTEKSATITTHPSSTTTYPSTTTTTRTTTTQTTTTTRQYPARWDILFISTTEDNIPFDDIEWTYKPAGNQLTLFCWHSSIINGSRTYYASKRCSVPMSDCIIVTGFKRPSNNGIYRVPAAIDGKLVVGVDMRDNLPGVYHFNDADVAPNVRRIYLPPETLVLYNNTIDQCTALERLYVSSYEIWIEPPALPPIPMTICGSSQCYMSCSPATSYQTMPTILKYCTSVQEPTGYFYSKDGYYTNVTLYSDPYPSIELYGYWWD